MLNSEFRSGTSSFWDQEEENKVKFTVIYQEKSGEMISDKNSEFNAILATYQLNITTPFELDQENKGLVLVSTIKQANPIKIGKELSLLDPVLMVTVDAPNKTSNTTNLN